MTRAKPQTRRSHNYTLVYEDADLLVVDKAAGVLTVPTLKRETNTLSGLLGRYLTRGQDRPSGLGVVHRLDRDTSGLLVFGKRRVVTDGLISQFAEHKPKRCYFAIVAGHLKAGSGSFRSRLTTDKNLNQRSTVRNGEGKDAVTHFEVVKRLMNATLVQVTLETGRRNQIRVHFAEAGHPVLGDQRYGFATADWPYKRLALHAASLGFTHPSSGENLCFESPLPRELSAYLNHEVKRGKATPEKSNTGRGPSSRPSRTSAVGRSNRPRS